MTPERSSSSGNFDSHKLVPLQIVFLRYASRLAFLTLELLRFALSRFAPQADNRMKIIAKNLTVFRSLF